MQNCYNYKFNLFNKYETPWEGTRVAKKKHLHSVDYLRQKIKHKNLKYSFLRFDKERSIEIFFDGGWLGMGCVSLLFKPSLHPIT